MSTLQKRFISMLALLILGGAGAYAVVWQKDESAQKKERKRAAQAVFNERDIKKVQAAAIEGPKQTISFARNEQNKWMIQTPIIDEADQAAVNSLLRYMLGAKRVREVGNEQDGVVTPPKDLSLYGLDKPNYRFSFTTVAGAAQELLIGRDTRFDKNYYAKLAESPEVFLIEYGLQFQYERELDGFRDKRFLELPLAKVQKLQVKSDVSSWLVEKRDGQFWVEDPVQALADKEQVEGVLSVLESLEIKGFLNEPQKLPKKLKNTAQVTITNTENQETIIKLYAYEKDSATVIYAEAQGAAARKAQAILQVDGAIARLQIDPEKLEDRRIARFDKDLITGVRIFKGELSMFFQKTPDGFWRLEGEERPVKAGVIQGLLYNLRRLQADKLGVQDPEESLLKTAGFETKDSGLELFGVDSESLLTIYVGNQFDEVQMVLSSDGRLDRVKQSDLSMLYFEADQYLQPSP